MKSKTCMVHRVPITKARVNLGQLARRAHVNKEYFILEKDGFPVIGIMDADELEDYLELQDQKIREHIRQSSEEFAAGKGSPVEELFARRAARSKAKEPSRQRKRG